MKLQMKREALKKTDRKANEGHLGFATVEAFRTRFGQQRAAARGSFQNGESGLKSEEVPASGA